MICRELKLRESGLLKAHICRKRLYTRELQKLCLKSSCMIESSHTAPVSCIDVDSSSGQYLLSCDFHGNVSVVNLRKHKRDRRTKPWQVKKASNSALRSCQWYPTDTGVFITAGVSGKVNVWDTKFPMKVIDEIKFGSAIKQCRISDSPGSSSTLVAVCGDNRSIYLYDLVSGARVISLIGHTAGVNTVAWSPTQPFSMISGSADSTIRSWDIRKPGWILSFDRDFDYEDCKHYYKPQTSPQKNAVALRAHSGQVTRVKYTNDGKRILSTGTDGRMRLWDAWRGCNMMVHYERTGNTKKVCAISFGSFIHETSNSDCTVWNISIRHICCIP